MPRRIEAECSRAIYINVNVLTLTLFHTKSISADVAPEAAASAPTTAAAAAPATSCCCCLVGGKGMVKGSQLMFARMLRLLLLFL